MPTFKKKTVSKHIFILSLLPLFFTIPIAAQQNNFRIEKISAEDGLKMNSAEGIIQDSLGFIWIGGVGLHKYDGYTFNSYFHNPADSNSLQSDIIYHLFQDNKKDLWISTQRGLQRYQYKTDNFKSYYFVNQKHDSIPYIVYGLQQDENGEYFAAINFAADSLYHKQDYINESQFSNFGIYTFDPENKKFTELEFVNRILKNNLNKNILSDKDKDGIYDVTINFPGILMHDMLTYRYVIIRKGKRIDREPTAEPLEVGFRVLKLDQNVIDLPITQFRKNNPLKIPYHPEQNIDKPITVHFNVDMNHLENPLVEGDRVEISGDLFPLDWSYECFIRDMTFDRDNMLWVALHRHGVYKFDLNKKAFQHYIMSPKNNHSLSDNHVKDIFVDSDADVWISTRLGLNKYNPVTDNFTRYLRDPENTNNLPQPVNYLSKIAEDSSGQLWISYHYLNKISRFDKHKGTFSHYSKNINAFSRSLIVDRSGVVWLGTMNQGVNMISIVDKFDTLTLSREGKNILENQQILAVYEDSKTNIWFGGQIGLYKFNPVSGEYDFYKTTYNNTDNLGSGSFRAIIEDSKGFIWILSQHTLNKWDPVKNSFTSYRNTFHHPNQLKGYFYSGMCMVNGTLWIVNQYGILNKLNPHNDKIQSFNLGLVQVEDMAYDPNGVLWIISQVDGLFRFDPQSEKVQKVINNSDGTCILADSTGKIWFNGINGLTGYDPKTNKRIQVSEKDGLVSNAITAIEIDNSGNIWLSSKAGITKYNPVKNSLKRYFKEDGFNTNQFGYYAHYKNNKGRIFFGSWNGVVSFHPDSIKDSDYKAPVVLTALKINNKIIESGPNSQFDHSIFTAKEIILEYDQNNISLAFAALDYNLAARNKYMYFLENFDAEWITAGSERTADYTNLDPGEYIFKVKGSNSDGVWNDDPRVLQITILPPWWKTAWAYTFYFFAFVALFLGIRRYELSRQQLKHDMEIEHVEAEKLKEVDNLKSRFFASISHEFRTPLTLIRGPVERLLKQIRDKKQISDLKRIEDNAVRMNKLVEMYLDLSRLESGNLQLQKEECDIIPLLKSVTASFESMAQASSIKLKFNTTITSAVCRVDREKFEMIWINLLSNALKFTPQNGEIITLVKALKHSKMLEISVSDTGIGLTEESLGRIFDMYYQAENEINSRISGTGIGLTMVKELVELHDGNIDVVSTAGEGTAFTITIPFISFSETVEESKITADDVLKEQIEAESADIFDKTDPGKERVLIVEDNHQMRAYIQSHLEDDYQTETAINGKLGFSSAVKNNPSLIISDVMMPEMDGYELCAKIKNDLRTSHIPVILLTAKAEEQDMYNGLEKGADTYLKKPFKADELLVRIKNLIENRKRLHQKFITEDHTDYKEFNITSADQAFLNKCLHVIEKNLASSDFSVEEFAGEMALSRSQLFRKIKALTGLSATKYIQTIRLKKSVALLSAQSGNISQIAYDCGFSNPSYFTKAFREMYGVSPTEYDKHS